MDTTRQRWGIGERVTVGIVAPGYGKTLILQHVATQGMRDGLIDACAIYTPRLALCRQSEISWTNEWRERHAAPRPECFRANSTGNQVPLDAGGFGFQSTFAAAAVRRDLHVAWARAHAFRFLLGLDEAALLTLGWHKEDDEHAGAAAETFAEMAKYAAHVLILTATPRRGDGRPLALCDEFYSDPDANGYRYLNPHAEIPYRVGVAERVLREYDSSIRQSGGTLELASGATSEIRSADGERLGDLLRGPKVWQALVDDVCDTLGAAQREHAGYRALISCSDQTHAGQVRDYIKSRHPRFQAVVAISNDGTQAHRHLESFRRGDGDILITVDMAFIGYDCPAITIVGVLTPKRTETYLWQLAGRGMRIWRPESGGPPIDAQKVRVIASDDPAMRRFLTELDEQSKRGIRERPGPPGPPRRRASAARLRTSGQAIHRPRIATGRSIRLRRPASQGSWRKSSSLCIRYASPPSSAP